MAAAFRAQLTCVSLCDVLGLPLVETPESVHLLVPRDRALRADDRRPHPGVVWHRHDTAWGDARLAPVSAALDVAGQCVTLRDHVALIDAAIRHRQVSEGAVNGFEISSEQRVRQLKGLMDPQADSILESWARVDLMGAGHRVKPQQRVGGRRRDLVVDDRVVIETDGKETHLTERAFVDDRRRDRLAVRDGYIVLRYTYADLVWEGSTLLADVEAALTLSRSAA